ncbi:MAG: dolichyl-phosphate-mannose--protein mannosyltransferase [Parvibaculum sp.]|nr:dolichyl-phosphate-mannose--protein mannosyltransferase [Parvibaculum sp.]|tara:strand:- start:4599 stop:6128 length:1530 start_codon:yes stop_codon:yes gene_type:complete
MVAIDPHDLNAEQKRAASAKRYFVLTRPDQQFLLIVLGVLFAVRLLAVFWFPFVDTTEARYAEIARKMVETGDWITPQFDYGVPFWGKPPLHTWLSAIGMKVFGIGPFGARVFIFATSLVILGLIFTWVRQHRGAHQALIATTVLASSALFFGASAYVMTDMVMVLGTTLSMIGFYNCMIGGPSRVLWGRLFFAGIAIGLLAKGPVALIITIIPIVPWLLLGGRWRNLHHLPWTSGLLIAAILTLPWYIAAEIKTPGFLRYFIIGEHYERFFVPGWEGDLYGSGHVAPKGIIWLYGLAIFLPWTLFAFALLPRATALLGKTPRDNRGWYSYLVLWVISPLVLFTPAANLLGTYALPGLPAAAVMLVSLWAQEWGGPGKKTRIAATTALGGVVAAFLTLTVLTYFFPATLDRRFERDLVAAAQSIDPDVAFTYWGGRSYSAEFYTQGNVRFTQRTGTFEALAENGARDAIALPQSVAAEIAPFLGERFNRIGQFNRRVLFIENLEEESAL